MGHCLVDADVPLQQGTQRRHALPLDTTRDDVVKPRQVGVAVQRQAVRGDVAAAVDPCRDIAWLVAVVCNTCDAPGRERVKTEQHERHCGVKLGK